MADTTLFGRLQRLFSTNVIVRNVGGKKLLSFANLKCAIWKFSNSIFPLPLGFWPKYGCAPSILSK